MINELKKYLCVRNLLYITHKELAICEDEEQRKVLKQRINDYKEMDDLFSSSFWFSVLIIFSVIGVFCLFFILVNLLFFLGG